jgi:NAD(P)-dependent dehydrogenase (short-subunit alcohol dehydrogenase family)
MDLQIRGKKALMAGGSAGMGRATAERLAEAGVKRKTRGTTAQCGTGDVEKVRN